MLPSLIRKIAKRSRFAQQFYRRLTRAPSDPYLAKIASLEHNRLMLFESGIPVPPIRLRDMVVRKLAILPEDFILLGKHSFDEIIQAATDGDALPAKNARILEFGVGCGRIARHFFKAGFEDFTGTDVDAELIAWCNDHLTAFANARFLRNGYLPPLPVADSGFDFVYSLSVFTHMTAESQCAWAKEMARVVKPGGALVISYLQKPASALPAGVAAIERIDPEYSRSWFGVGGAPSVYYNTFNSREYLTQLFAEAFELRAHRDLVLHDVQSVALFVRRC
jgi:ubiquinone/menaquinone biosynthesis C-methylase UbiE